MRSYRIHERKQNPDLAPLQLLERAVERARAQHQQSRMERQRVYTQQLRQTVYNFAVHNNNTSDGDFTSQNRSTAVAEPTKNSKESVKTTEDAILFSNIFLKGFDLCL